MAIQVKTTEQYFLVVLFIMVHKVVLTFTRKIYHSYTVYMLSLSVTIEMTATASTLSLFCLFKN